MSESITEQYKKQWQWRNWDALFNLLPEINGKTIYDIGCAHGDHSYKLSELGARIIGLDGNQELLEAAEARGIQGAKFIKTDLTSFDYVNAEKADGVWTSFVAAYFTDLSTFIQNLSTLIKPGGFLAITEMDDLFAHGPGMERYRGQILDFYQNALDRRAYDFRSGSKLRIAIESAGLAIEKSADLNDRELSSSGPLDPTVIRAWENRLARMPGLQSFLGESFEGFRSDFLACLQSPEHRSECRSLFFLAIKE